MAYYSNSSYYDPIYHQNLYAGYSSDIVQSQPSITYPDDPSQPLITYPNEYDHYNYHPNFYNNNAYDSAPSHSIVSYFASTFSEPKYIELEHDHNFTISYSVAGGFNEPDFLEYDPTPYGGGYDITQHYGKSLPPSKETCYPLSNPNSKSSSPLNKEDKAGELVPKSSKEIILTTIKEEVSETENEESDKSEDESDSESEKGQEQNESGEEQNESGDNISAEKGSDGDRVHGHEQEKAVSQARPGYGLGSMDLCGSIYDYWPCLNRDRKGNGFGDCRQEGNNTEGYHDQWEGAADYIFGSSYPYSGRRDAAGSYESAIYGYERHFQQESLKFEQLAYGEDSYEGQYTLH